MMTIDFSTSAALDRISRLEAGLDDLAERLDDEIARYDLAARRLRSWDVVMRVLVTMLAVLAPVAVTIAAVVPLIGPWWAVGTATAAGAMVLLWRTIELDRRYIIARTVSGRLAELRRRTEFDLSDLPADHTEHHAALRRRVTQLVDGYVDILGEHARAEISAIGRIDGLGGYR
jgi:hypothetical protein